MAECSIFHLSSSVQLTECTQPLFEEAQCELYFASQTPRVELFSCQPWRPDVNDCDHGGFVHDSFRLPDTLRRLAWEYRESDPTFSEQLTYDVDRNEAISELPPLQYVGGFDISFIPDSNCGVTCLVILTYPEMKIVATYMEECELTQPYVDGFLGVREAPLFEHLFHQCSEKMKTAKHLPQLILIDGCGAHHPRRGGLAVQLGVRLGIPAVGCAKNMLFVGGTNDKEVYSAIDMKSKLPSVPPKVHTIYPIVSHDATPPILYGYAIKTSPSVKKCIYASPGTRMGYAVSAALVMTMCLHRVPEPTRQADLKSRDYIRELGTSAASS